MRCKFYGNDKWIYSGKFILHKVIKFEDHFSIAAYNILPKINVLVGGDSSSVVVPLLLSDIFKINLPNEVSINFIA